MTALADLHVTDADVRAALIASLGERLTVATQYEPAMSEELRERFAVLTYGHDTAQGRETEELRRLHASAGRLLAALAQQAEAEHCRGSAYACDPEVWGCHCDCAACAAVRAL